MKKIKKRLKSTITGKYTKRIITNTQNLGKVYHSSTGSLTTNDEPPYDTRTSRTDDDDNGLVSGIATILAAEIVEDIVEAVFDSPTIDTQSDTQDFGGFGGGDSQGSGAVDSY